MTKAWFEVEWSDADLDKKRSEAKRAGQTPPARKSLLTFLLFLSDRHLSSLTLPAFMIFIGG
jgi:hypothetical protein